MKNLLTCRKKFPTKKIKTSVETKQQTKPLILFKKIIQEILKLY